MHLADDHTMFREGLEALLASRQGVEVVGASSTGEEATTSVAKSKPDLIITQLDMHLKIRLPENSTSPRPPSSATWPTSTRRWACAPGARR